MTTSILKLVPKLLIPPIRQISKLNVRLMAQHALVNQFIAALVLPHIVCSQHKCQNDGNGASHDDGDLGWDEIWGGFFGEGEGTDDVA